MQCAPLELLFNGLGNSEGQMDFSQPKLFLGQEGDVGQAWARQLFLLGCPDGHRSLTTHSTSSMPRQRDREIKTLELGEGTNGTNQLQIYMDGFLQSLAALCAKRHLYLAMCLAALSTHIFLSVLLVYPST